MALNYAALDALTTNATFLARTRQALRFVAAYHRNNQASTQEQRDWAQSTIDNRRIDVIATQMVSELVTDSGIIGSTDPTDPAAFTDESFKAAVETMCFSYAG